MFNSSMSTVFEKIISGEWAGRFVWADDVCVAISTIEPVSDGHVLVIPRQPWESWTDCPAHIARHLMEVAHAIGQAQKVAFNVDRIGLIIAGFEVPHTHLHVIPARSEADCLLTNARKATDEELDVAANRLREELKAQGQKGCVPKNLHSLT